MATAAGLQNAACRARQIVEACVERGVRYLTLDEALEWFSARDRRFGTSSAALVR